MDRYDNLKDEIANDELYQYLEDYGLVCQCGGIMDKSVIQGEVQLICAHCGETYTQKTPRGGEV